MSKLTPQGKTDHIAHELESIRRRDPRGNLAPESVVEWAKKHPNSVLHSRFTWDDTEAAHQYRLSQARTIIVSVKISIPDTNDGKVSVKVKEFKSLTDNRGNGGGYERTVHVLSDSERRRQLLLDTIARLCEIENLRIMPELAAVWREVQKVRNIYPVQPTFAEAAE